MTTVDWSLRSEEQWCALSRVQTQTRTVSDTVPLTPTMSGHCFHSGDTETLSTVLLTKSRVITTLRVNNHVTVSALSHMIIVC